MAAFILGPAPPNESSAMAAAMRVARRSKRQTSLLDNAARLKGTPDVAHLVWPVATRISKLTARRLVITFVPTTSGKLVRDIGWRDELTLRGYTRTVHGVGDLVAGIDGSWMVRPPARCANGHPLRGRCIGGTTPCSCQDQAPGRRTCDACGDTTYGPALRTSLQRATRAGCGSGSRTRRPPAQCPGVSWLG